MSPEVANQAFPLICGQSLRVNQRPWRLAEPVRVLKAEHSQVIHDGQSDRIVLYNRNFRAHLGSQLVRVAARQRSETRERIAAAFFLIQLDSRSGFVSRMHEDANENCHRHAKSRAGCHNAPSLPGNKREIPERHLVFGIEEAAAFGKPLSGPACLGFIFFKQLGSFSQASDCRFIRSDLLPLAQQQ
jgi:hypothetical protein